MSEKREHILTHACELYLEKGLKGFSMRKLAHAVGVTAPALYRHYESKERVLLDVVGEAYKRLAEYLYRGLQGRTPEERFTMAGEGYLSFALENPRLYEVLFAFPDLRRVTDVPPEVRDRACAVGQFWNDRVRECMDAGILRPIDPGDVGQTLWAHAHGLVSLYLRGMLPIDETTFRQIYRASTARLLVGLATPEYGRSLDTDGLRTEALTDAVAPITLDEAVVRALDSNRQLAAARANLDEANERVSEAWGSLYPAVDLSMTYTRNVSPAVNFLPASFFDPDAPPDEQIAVRFGADNTWDGLIGVEQALFRPAVFLGVGAASRFESLQEEVVRGQVHDVVTEVRGAYIDLLLAQEQRRLTDNSVRRVRQALQETRAMNEAGLTSDYDVLRLEVELANLEPNLLRAENATRQATRRLAVLLNLEVTDDLTVAGELASMNLDDLGANSEANRAILSFGGREAPPLPEGGEVEALVGSAVESRPDVRQAELTERLRHTEMRVEQMDYLPEIALFGAYQVNASQNGDPTFFGSPRAYARRVGVTVTLPVFNGFQRESRIDQKRALARAAEAQASLARDQAESEVRDVLDQVSEARQRAGAQSRAVGQARRGFEIASAQYREGIGSQLERTDAEVALRQSEFNYAQAVYDYLLARARLDRATGDVPLSGRAAR